jgi:L-ascorbate metabolism protein UlaG (beta-lactamase superfamily)
MTHGPPSVNPASVNGRPAHHHGKRFRNPSGAAGRGLKALLLWAASRQRQRWPARVENTHQPAIPGALPRGAIAATFINQSSFLLQLGSFNLLTDPVYSERVGPLNLGGPKRVRAPGVPFDALPRIDGVLLSHNHYDHLDLPTLKRLARAGDPLVVTGLRNGRLLRQHGLRRVIELDWWEGHELGERLSVTFVPAQHFSSRGLHDRDRTLWGGFVLQAGAQRIYFAGDSGYGQHFQEIGRRVGPMDLALIPIGAYEPRWFMHPMHVNPAEAVQAHLDVQSRFSLGMHFGTFQLTDEGIEDPIHALRAALRARGVPVEQFRAPEFGQTVVVPAKGG